MDQPHDVEVILNHNRRYKFQSGVLARNSTLFAEFLTEANAIKLRPQAVKQGSTTRWMVELQKLPTLDTPAGELGLVKLDNWGNPIDHGPFNILNENGRVPLKIFDHYESILSAFNGGEVKISDTDMTTALEDAVEIIQIAEYLGAVPIISKPIDVALFKQGQVLFRSIAGHPWAWVSMAYRIQSEMIFKESIVHLVGNWNKIAEQHKKQLKPCIHEICIKHHDKLNERRKRLEITLSSLYPGGMAAPSNELPIRREEYAKDILVWMALSFFRHWFTQRIIDKKGMVGPDGGYGLYKQLGTAGDAYMDKEVINQFHVKFPMTKKAMNVLENHLLEIKECIKAVVDRHGILNSKSQLDVHRYEVKYLTCIELDKSDLPWFNQNQELPMHLHEGRSAADILGQLSANNNESRAPAKRVRNQRPSDGEDLEENVDNKRPRHGDA